MTTDSVHDHPLLHGLTPDVVQGILRIADAVEKEPAQWINGIQESIPLVTLSQLAGFSQSYAARAKANNYITKEGAIALAAATWYADKSETPPAQVSALKHFAPPDVQQRYDAVLAEYARSYRKVVQNA